MTGPRTGRPPGSKRDATGLTPREKEVVRLIAQGLTSKAISVALGIGIRTVTNTISSAYRGTNTWSRPELVLHAVKSGVVDLEQAA